MYKEMKKIVEVRNKHGNGDEFPDFADLFFLARLDAFIEKSVKPEIVNRYDLWVLQNKIGGAKVFVNNVQWSDQMM
jgi:hypothetical protein